MATYGVFEGPVVTHGAFFFAFTTHTKDDFFNDDFMRWATYGMCLKDLSSRIVHLNTSDFGVGLLSMLGFFIDNLD